MASNFGHVEEGEADAAVDPYADPEDPELVAKAKRDIEEEKRSKKRKKKEDKEVNERTGAIIIAALLDKRAGEDAENQRQVLEVPSATDDEDEQEIDAHCGDSDGTCKRFLAGVEAVL